MHTCGELNQIVIDFLKRICDLTFYKLEVYSKTRLIALLLWIKP